MPQEALDVTSPAEGTSQAPDKGGSSVDFEALFGETRQELEATKQHSQKISQDFESFKSEAKKTQETLDRLKGVFTGGEKTEADPLQATIQSLEDEISEWVQAAHESDKAGRPITRTAKLGIERARDKIEALKDKAEMQKTITELKGKLDKVTDPNEMLNQHAYSSMDAITQNALMAVYGPGEERAHIRNTQFKAVTELIGDEIRSLVQEDPKAWDRIRRDPTAQRKLVNHVIKENLPPVARKLMEEDQIKRTPLGMNEIHAAYREAKELVAKNPKDTHARQMVAELKSQLFAGLWNRAAGKSNRIKASEFLD